MARTTSEPGRATLIQREGCRLTAYQDSVGVWTIGIGHTGRATLPRVFPGMSITQAEAEAMLATDLQPFEAAVNKAVARPVTQNQFDAMVSLAFNIGSGGFTGSTVVHKLNAGDPAGAADAFLMWMRPPELKQRRIAERRQFLTPDAPLPAPVAAPDMDTTPAASRLVQAKHSWFDRLRAGLSFRKAS